MKEILIAVALAVVLSVAGFYTWKVLGSSAAPARPEGVFPVGIDYASSTMGIFLTVPTGVYPTDYFEDETYAYDQFGPNKLIRGVSFTIPAEMATGTNLSSDTYLSVEQLPRAKNCTGDIYLEANVTAHNVTENGTEYSFASSTSAAAGNLYEEQVFALATSSPCTAIRYYIHSGNIGNYPAGTVREFDRGALLSAFDKIRQSLISVK